MIMRENIKDLFGNIIKEFERLVGRPEMAEELKPILVPTNDEKPEQTKDRKVSFGCLRNY